MRFRIEEYRRPSTGLSHRFIVQYKTEAWPFGYWLDFYRKEYPCERAQFETLKEARDFICEEKYKQAYDKRLAKEIASIYHRP